MHTNLPAQSNSSCEGHSVDGTTVEPRLSKPRSSETSIIRTRDIIILMIFIVRNSTRACAYGQPRMLAATHWQII